MSVSLSWVQNDEEPCFSAMILCPAPVRHLMPFVLASSKSYSHRSTYRNNHSSANSISLDVYDVVPSTHCNTRRNGCCVCIEFKGPGLVYDFAQGCFESRQWSLRSSKTTSTTLEQDTNTITLQHRRYYGSLCHIGTDSGDTNLELQILITGQRRTSVKLSSLITSQKASCSI